MARAAAGRVGAVGVLVLPEGRMDWKTVKDIADGLPFYVAVESDRSAEEVREAGLIAVEVEPTDAAIIERITLALIEAVANDLLRAGARVVVVYSGFEADELDTMTVVRLGEHLERLTARDLRALETSVPFETLKAVVDIAVEIGRGHADCRGRRQGGARPLADPGLRPVPRLSQKRPEPPRPACS
jgi:diadenylate cyclase